MTHHVGGVSVMGPTDELKGFMKYVARTMLISVSDMIDVGSGYEPLADEKHRQVGGWWAGSNPKYLKGAMEAFGLQEARLQAMTPTSTPGTKREA